LFKGTVTANTTTDYTKNTALGELSKIDVIDGQKVNIGDILLTYTSSSDDLSSQEFEVKNSKNNLSNAKSDLLEITNKDVTLRSKLSKVKDNVEKQEITNQIEINNDAWKTAQRAVTALN
jgi:HlyD family secretion protein